LQQLGPELGQANIKGNDVRRNSMGSRNNHQVPAEFSKLEHVLTSMNQSPMSKSFSQTSVGFTRKDLSILQGDKGDMENNLSGMESPHQGMRNSISVPSLISQLHDPPPVTPPSKLSSSVSPKKAGTMQLPQNGPSPTGGLRPSRDGRRKSASDIFVSSGSALVQQPKTPTSMVTRAQAANGAASPGSFAQGRRRSLPCLNSLPKVPDVPAAKMTPEPPHAARIFALLTSTSGGVLDAFDYSDFDQRARTICPAIARHDIMPAQVAGQAGEVNEKDWMEYIAAIVDAIGLQAWEGVAMKMTQELYRQRR
jgi:hypothetical protein